MYYINRAVVARLQKWQSAHFEKTKDGKKLRTLKGRHKGQKCFVIGNGPSLQAHDLQILHDNRIKTFATNRIYNIFPQTDWRPTYYVSEDANVLRGVQKEASAIVADAKFVPINLKWFEDIRIDDATYFFMDYKSPLDKEYGLSLDISHRI